MHSLELKMDISSAHGHVCYLLLLLKPGLQGLYVLLQGARGCFGVTRWGRGLLGHASLLLRQHQLAHPGAQARCQRPAQAALAISPPGCAIFVMLSSWSSCNLDEQWAR